MGVLLVLFIITASIYGMYCLDEFMTRKRIENEEKLRAEAQRLEEELFRLNVKTLWRNTEDLDKEERQREKESE